jgi:hypothetical protein
VVGTHAARGVQRLLLGSVADKVIRGATQTVLVVPTLQEDARALVRDLMTPDARRAERAWRWSRTSLAAPGYA